MGVRVPPGRLSVSVGAQVLAAASPALTRVVRVQVPRALLDGWRTGVWCNGSMAASKSARCGFESYRPCWSVEGTHDVAAACRLAMADVRVRLPLGALTAATHL